jgi:hypothetical protein
MREKARHDRSSVSEVSIDHNNQKMIAMLAVLPNIEDSFLSRSENCAHLDYENEKRMLGRSQLFWKQASFFMTILKMYRNHPMNLSERRPATYRHVMLRKRLIKMFGTTNSDLSLPLDRQCP